MGAEDRRVPSSNRRDRVRRRLLYDRESRKAPASAAIVHGLHEPSTSAGTR